MEAFVTLAVGASFIVHFVVKYICANLWHFSQPIPNNPFPPMPESVFACFGETDARALWRAENYGDSNVRA